MIDILTTNGYIILGGDVYYIDKVNGDISSRGDNWYYEEVADEDAVVKSHKKAVTYIVNFHNRNGGNFYYSVVCRHKADPRNDTED